MPMVPPITSRERDFRDRIELADVLDRLADALREGRASIAEPTEVQADLTGWTYNIHIHMKD